MKTDAKHNADVLWEWLHRGFFPIYIYGRSRKVYTGGGQWHWATDYLLNCEEDRKIDADRFAQNAGIRQNGTPLFSYALAHNYPNLKVDVHGSLLVIDRKSNRKSGVWRA